MIAGANRDDYHLRNVTVGEDFDAAFHTSARSLPATVHALRRRDRGA